MITAEQARELLDYNPTTGALIWRARPGQSPQDMRFNRLHAGREAGRDNFTGSNTYRKVTIDRRTFYAHRLIWLIVHGEWPPEFVDHANGDSLDNRLENLRLATRGQNRANCKPPSEGRYRGVAKTPSGKFRAAFTPTAFYQSFDTAEEAARARDAAALAYHGEFARLNFPNEVRPS